MDEQSYTASVETQPDSDGHYRARVYLNEKWLKTFYNSDRDKAIADARKYVEWHREHDDFEEVIVL